MSDRTGRYFVMCVYRDEPDKAFPLFLDPVTAQEARQRIRWQRQAGDWAGGEYRLCTIQGGAMVDESGNALNVVQGCYTDAAFAELTARLQKCEGGAAC